jgi:TonB family protein
MRIGRTMRSAACLLLPLVLCAPFALAQDPTPAATPAPGDPQAQSPSPVPDKDGVYHQGPGVDAPYLTSPAMAAIPDGADLSRPRIVHFTAVIAADGSVARLDVIAPQGDALETAAATAIQQSKFAPGTVNGNPVPVEVCGRVPFIHVQPAIPRLGPCLPSGVAGPGSAFRMPPGVTPPHPIDTPLPEYSDQARKKKINGTVLISTLVNEQGLPTDIRVERGIGYGLDENAVRCVSQYRFDPARDRDGKPVAVRIAIEVSYRLY